MIKCKDKNWYQEGEKSANGAGQHIPHACLFACPHANMPIRGFKISKLGLTKLMMC